MTEVTKYKCDLCGTLYTSKLACDECEKQHQIPDKIVRADHRAMKSVPGYPPYIYVKFKDGSERKYKREGRN